MADEMGILTTGDSSGPNSNHSSVKAPDEEEKPKKKKKKEKEEMQFDKINQ